MCRHVSECFLSHRYVCENSTLSYNFFHLQFKTLYLIGGGRVKAVLQAYFIYINFGKKAMATLSPYPY